MNYFKFLSVFLIAIAISNTSAAPAIDELDSLLNAISTQKDEIEKVENILLIAKKYAKIDKDSAMMFARQAFALSDQLDYDKGRLSALSRMGYLQKQVGNYNASYEYFTELLELSEKVQDSSYMAKAYLEYANLYRRMGKDRLVLFYHQKSIPIYLKLNNKVGLISNYNSLGSLFKNNAKYDSSAFYYMRAIKLIKEEPKMMPYLVTVYHNLGGTYKELKDYKNARMYLFMALQLINKKTNKESLADIYTKLGNVANEEMDLDSALYYYKLAEPLFRETKDMRGISDLYINYGIVFHNKGLNDLAHNNFNLALKYYKQQNFPEGIIVAWQNIAKLYSDQTNYTEALILMDSCLLLAQNSGLKNGRINSLLQMSEIYYESGNYKLSYNYFNRYINLKDSIYQIEKEEIIADLMIQYDRELDQARLLIQKDEIHKKTKQRNIYFFTGLGLVALSLFIILYLRLTARKNRIISEQRILQLEEEKKLLAARFLVEGQEEERKRIATELHDGLGVLLSATKLQFTSIKDPTPANKPLLEKATQFLEQASSDVRKISHNMMPGLLTKLGLCEALEDLFEKLEDTEGMDALCEIKGARERLPENKEIMIYRIVQELVNNTLKHANAKKIQLKINVMPAKLDIYFSDDGKGFDVDKMLEQKSIGLQSIFSRVKFLDGTVSIDSGADKGTVFTMQIPIISDQ